MNEEIKKEEEVLTEEQLQEKIDNGVKSAFEGFKNEVIAEVKSASMNEKELKQKAIENFGETLKSAIRGEFKATPSTTTFGNVVPTEVADFILTKRDNYSTMRAGATVLKHNGPLELPLLDTGMTAYWVAENATITASEPTTSAISLDDHYLACRVILPKKLINTSNVNLVSFFEDVSARKIAETEDLAFTNGTGTGMPTGFRTSTLPTSQTLSQSGTNFSYDDLMDLYFAVKPQYRANAVIMTSSKGASILRKLKDNNGLPIFDPSTNRVLGKELVENVYIPEDLGTGSDETEIYIGDRSAYYIKDGEEITMENGKIISALQTEIVVYEATDGELGDVNAFAKITGVK